MGIRCPTGYHYSRLLDECVPDEPSPTTPPPTPEPTPDPPAPIVVTEGGLPVPTVKITSGGILGKICGEANEVVFIGFSDLFQVIVDYFIPDFWPLDYLEGVFNNVFDNLQENLKPFAYNQGVAMGDQIEAKVEAWIKSKFDFAMDELQKARNQALAEIAEAEKQLREHTQKIQDLLERVGKLEGKSGLLGGLFQ